MTNKKDIIRWIAITCTVIIAAFITAFLLIFGVIPNTSYLLLIIVTLPILLFFTTKTLAPKYKIATGIIAVILAFIVTVVIINIAITVYKDTIMQYMCYDLSSVYCSISGPW